MRLEPLGDTALVLRDLTGDPALIARAILMSGIDGVEAVVPCAETVGIHFSRPLDPETLLRAAETPIASGSFTTFDVPVCYELGPDLGATARHLDLSPEALITLHESMAFRCFAIGFCPGFAYCGPLPSALRGVPRLATPRKATEPGSVGLTGNQTAVYPLERPGGWPIIGRTPVTLVDVADDYFPIAVGDSLRFYAISREEYGRRQGERL